MEQPQFQLLDEAKFISSHELISDTLPIPNPLRNAFQFDTERPYLSFDGKLVGYYIKGMPNCAFEIDMIVEALEQGFATKGWSTLQIIN